jgi:hypothetical protein
MHHCDGDRVGVRGMAFPMICRARSAHSPVDRSRDDDSICDVKVADR